MPDHKLTLRRCATERRGKGWGIVSATATQLVSLIYGPYITNNPRQASCFTDVHVTTYTVDLELTWICSMFSSHELVYCPSRTRLSESYNIPSNSPLSRTKRDFPLPYLSQHSVFRTAKLMTLSEQQKETT